MAKKKIITHPFFIIAFILGTVGGLTAGVLSLGRDIKAPTHTVEQVIDPSILASHGQ
jgi:hypothetical protein